MKISNTVLILAVIAMTNIVSTEAKKNGDNHMRNLVYPDEGNEDGDDHFAYQPPGDDHKAYQPPGDDHKAYQPPCSYHIMTGKTNRREWRPCHGQHDRRALVAMDEQVLWGPEFDDCWEETYENALYADSSHLFVLAVPKNKDSNCPTIALDNGFSGGKGHGWELAPMLTISDKVPEGVLFLDHTVTLMSFSDAINQLSPANYVISENEYNIVENNCATYLLDLAKKVGLDYKDPNTVTKIENYVGKSLAANDVTVDKIRQAYLEQNKGIFHRASFYVWNFAVGDEGMTRALVRSYMTKIVEE